MYPECLHADRRTHTHANTHAYIHMNKRTCTHAHAYTSRTSVHVQDFEALLLLDDSVAKKTLDKDLVESFPSVVVAEEGKHALSQ